MPRSDGCRPIQPIASRRRKIGIRPLIRRLEAQPHVLAGHAEVHQLVGHAVIGTVALHPDLLALAVDMDQAGVDAPVVVPADGQEGVVALLVVEEELGVEFLRRAGVGVGRMLGDDLADEGAVVGDWGRIRNSRITFGTIRIDS